MSSKYSRFNGFAELLNSAKNYYDDLAGVNTYTATIKVKTVEKNENLQEFAEYIQRKLNLSDIRSTENDIHFIEYVDGTTHIYEILIRIVYEEEHIRFVCTFYHDGNIIEISSDEEED